MGLLYTSPTRTGLAAGSMNLPLTRSDALAAVRASIARGSCTPTFDRNPDDYLQEAAARLMSFLIEPQPARVREACYPEHGVLELTRSHPTWAIASGSEHHLVFVPATGDFLLAFGKNLDSLMALGFYSDDALAEWCG